MRNKIVPVLSIISLFGILVMVNFTTPLDAGVLGVLVFFTMIFILLFGVMVELIKIFQKISTPLIFQMLMHHLVKSLVKKLVTIW